MDKDSWWKYFLSMFSVYVLKKGISLMSSEEKGGSMDLEKQLGPEAKVSITSGNGKVRLNIAYDGKQADAGMFVEVEPALFVDELANLIPGNSPLKAEIVALVKAAIGSAL